MAARAPHHIHRTAAFAPLQMLEKRLDKQPNPLQPPPGSSPNGSLKETGSFPTYEYKSGSGPPGNASGSSDRVEVPSPVEVQAGRSVVLPPGELVAVRVGRSR